MVKPAQGYALNRSGGKTPAEVRQISIAVYKMRLGPKDTARMLAKDADDGEKLSERASAYDPLTRCYLEALAAD